MDLVNKRNELKDLLDQETRRDLNLIARERYLWGNKTNKHLARMVQKKK